ncbi:4Fe-4S binding protein [Elioraea thermophila]|uniref:4Fe-4S binding protein n=1 Tax=Elioraea thermophila TaxID=2185104 RepID=UPI0018E55163|nr:4Fe-4S binding protein [Elioraea thermophila]
MADGTQGDPRGERTVFVCSCEGTMPLDERALAKGCRGARLETARQLCRAELPRLAAALAKGEVLVGCVQERAVFADAAAEAKSGHAVDTVRLRETAGWSAEADRAGPKMAALIAAAQVPMPPTPIVTYRSEGVALVYGRDERAIEAARRLSAKLNLTVLLADPKDVAPPRATEFPVVKGRIVRASGHLGAFELVVDDYAAPSPSSRASLVFGPARNGAKSRADLILDLSGLTPLFPAPHKRPGYLRADPNDPVAVERAIFAAADLVGTFDKPRFVAFTEALCAHSRSRKTGCTRCLDLCPVGAIRPNGDAVALDPMICAGCGSCSAVCPTGAASYALPPADALLRRLRALLLTYREAGGERPVLLIHEVEHGEPLIEALARFGDGLPARVLPFALNEVTALGLETVAAAFAYGAAELRVLLPARARADLEALHRTLALADTVLRAWGFGEGRVGTIEASDPDALAAALAALPKREGVAVLRTFAPMGDKRSLAQLSLRELAKAAPAPVDIVPLPEKAPFGTLAVNAEGCTLCLSCVSACPTGALRDNPDRPQLSFVEDACVQCGLCAATCPEKVITLVPRLNVGADVVTPRVIKEEEPFACIRCGKPFGVKSSIERVVAKLAASHWMYKGNAANLELMRMCEDCRVIAVTETSGIDPYAGPPRPKILTGDDV